jgi:hypothetical protein
MRQGYHHSASSGHSPDVVGRYGRPAGLYELAEDAATMTIDSEGQEAE